MATVIINERSTGAKKMLEFLKTQSYAKIIDDETINEVKQGLKELDLARKGKLKGKTAKQYLSEL
jgi:hypothetical protein